MHNEVIESLKRFSNGDSTKSNVKSLLNAMGYHSKRVPKTTSLKTFLALLERDNVLTDRQHKLIDAWDDVDFVFQLTRDEIIGYSSLFSKFEKGQQKSFLFIAVRLKPSIYSRTALAEMTRIANRSFRMPVIVMFFNKPTLTIAAVHRRAHRRTTNRDVLERVSLVKDIHTETPHRAHIEILADLMLFRLANDRTVRDIDTLHEAWERILDIDRLNAKFFREIFTWFNRAVSTSRFPDDGSGDGSNKRHIIRLITRLLFIWFMKEKGLVPGELFELSFAKSALKHYDTDQTDYYRAILQNLFFATLNTEIDKRGFRRLPRTVASDFSNYLYSELLQNPDDFVERLKLVPFVNGGLFDCLDRFSETGSNEVLIDAFNEDPANRDSLHVPATLFFDSTDGLFTLFRRYKFTVEESTPLEQEVALDPELLGRVFEHLLATYIPETSDTAQQTTGSYYTPRETVDYMVKEALAQALAPKLEIAEGNLKYWYRQLCELFSHSIPMDKAIQHFSYNERVAIVAAIRNVTILDPAVGSGAFPMGILQTLTLALRRLDPDGSIQQTLTSAGSGSVSSTICDNETVSTVSQEISTVVSDEYGSDFGRKYFLIQNCIYGVDIQPIACQIAKLRFFISLAIEQEIDVDLPNLGFRPLPNLETRIVSADALINLRSDMESFLYDETVESILGKLSTVRERYFLAHRPHEKSYCIREERRLRGELANLISRRRKNLESSNRRKIRSKAEALPSLAARKMFLDSELQRLEVGRARFQQELFNAYRVATWDPYDLNSCASWFNPRFMFGLEGGFDVVIGNPPYIQLRKNRGQLANLYTNSGYTTFTRTGDIYHLFYERGCRLLKSTTGILAFITSNSFLRAESGKALRSWLTEFHTPLRLIEMGKNVFDATVDVCVLIVREGKTVDRRLPAVDVDRLDGDAFPPAPRKWGETRLSGDGPWRILSPLEWQVLEKMNSKGIPLRDWDVKINRGILTGCNEAFIIGAAQRRALIEADPCSDEVIVPILHGRNIQRYLAHFEDQYLIDLHNGFEDVPAVDVNDYFAIKDHLDRFRPSFDNRQARGCTPYNLRECAFHEDFRKKKIIWIELSDQGRFAYDTSGMFGDYSTLILTGESIEYLCAILNRNLVSWYIKNTAPTSGEGTCRWMKVYVESIPVPYVSFDQQKPIVEILNQIVAARETNWGANIDLAETELDKLVYALYGLSETEIDEIERVT